MNELTQEVQKLLVKKQKELLNSFLMFCQNNSVDVQDAGEFVRVDRISKQIEFWKEKINNEISDSEEDAFPFSPQNESSEVGE